MSCEAKTNAATAQAPSSREAVITMNHLTTTERFGEPIGLTEVPLADPLPTSPHPKLIPSSLEGKLKELNNNNGRTEDCVTAAPEERRIKVQLTWKNIQVWPKEETACAPVSCRGADYLTPDNKRMILRGVSGTVKPGQFLSIIGSTGAGKTTLLQLLSGKMFPSNLAWRGQIEINGEPRDSVDYSRFTAFVQQDDILMENLSVKECLQFAADVKSPGTYQERRNRVHDLLEELELLECSDIKFGNDMLRKGEKKRASIGVELITNPSLLYVDEPTTGMDSFTAGKLVELMGKLAKRGRTIIATIHQPNSEIFAMFDQLMILALGRIIYFNAASKAVQYFDNLGYVCPKQKNPAEHFMKILSADNFMKPDDVGDTLEIARQRYEAAVIEMHDSYQKPDNAFKCDVEVVAEDATKLSDSKLSELKYVAPWWMQFGYLCKRAAINNMRSPQTTFIRIFTTIFTMVLGTALYCRLGYDGYEAMQNRVGTVFYLITFCLLESIQNVVLVFPEERAVFLREQASSLYDISAYFMGKVIAELPLNLIVPIIAIVLTYWSWNLNDVYSYNFWVNLAVLELMYLAGCGYGLILGSLISDRTVMISTLPVVTLPLLLLSGFLVTITKNTHIMWILQYLSPCKYGFGIGIRNEFEDSRIRMGVMTPHGPVYVDGNYILNTLFKPDPSDWWANFFALSCLVIASHFVAFVILRIYGKRV